MNVCRLDREADRDLMGSPDTAHEPRTILRCTFSDCTEAWVEVNGRHEPTVRRALLWGWTGGESWRRFAGCLCADGEQRCPDHPHDLSATPTQPTPEEQR